MQQLRAGLKVNVAADVHAVALGGVLGVSLIALVGHEVILDVFRGVLHARRTVMAARPGPAVGITGHVELGAAAGGHQHIAEEHRHKALRGGIFIVGGIAIGSLLFQLGPVGTLPVGIVVPIGQGATAPHHVLGHHLHGHYKRAVAGVGLLAIIGIFLLKMHGKRVRIALPGLEAEGPAAAQVNRALGVEVHVHAVIIL